MPAPSATAAPARRYQDLPGPPQLPLLGNLHQMRPSRFHQQLEAWHARYGECFRLRIANRPFLAVAEPTAIAAALRDRPFVVRRTKHLVFNATEMGFDGIVVADGERWQQQRPLVMAAFAPGQVRHYFPTLVKVTERMAGRWRRAAAERREIELSGDLRRFTVDVVAGLSFGADINTIERADDDFQRHIEAVFPMLTRRLTAPFPYWHYLRFKSDREFELHLKAVHGAVKDFIDDARARLQDPARRAAPANLIEAMLVARDDPANGLTDRDVAGNVMSLLLAGQDTSSHTLAWTIYLLARHPEVRARAEAEVRALTGGDVPRSFDQAEAMDYLEACIHESMRLKPAAPLTVAQASVATVIGGVDVPAGCGLMFSIRPAAVDARHFPEPGAYRPERWLQGADGATTGTRRVAIPFGAGPRICPGRYLALLEMKMLLALLLSCFDIDDLRTPDGGPAQEKLTLTMAPLGLTLRLKARG